VPSPEWSPLALDLPFPWPRPSRALTPSSIMHRNPRMLPAGGETALLPTEQILEFQGGGKTSLAASQLRPSPQSYAWQ
jgi:hypothetical protein